MASSIRFDTHLKTAVDVASMVARSAGIDVLKPAPTTVTWLQPLVDDQINANGQNDLDEDPDDGSVPVELKHFDGDDVVDSLGTLLDDFIEDEGDHEDDHATSALTTPSSNSAIVLRWEPLVSDIICTVSLLNRCIHHRLAPFTTLPCYKRSGSTLLDLLQ
jgi:hypothetical protein